MSPKRTAWCKGVTHVAFFARWSAPRRSNARAASIAFSLFDVAFAARAARCSGASPASPSSRRLTSAPAFISTATVRACAIDAATCKGASPVTRDRRFTNRSRRVFLNNSSARRSAASTRAKASRPDAPENRRSRFCASSVSSFGCVPEASSSSFASPRRHSSKTPSRLNHAVSSASSTSTRLASNATPARAEETTSGRPRLSARQRTEAGVIPSLQRRGPLRLFPSGFPFESVGKPWSKISASSPCSSTYARISATAAGRSRSHAACNTSRPRASSAESSAPRSSRNRNRHAHPLRAATCAGVSPSPFTARTTRNCSKPAATCSSARDASSSTMSKRVAEERPLRLVIVFNR